MPEKPQPRTTVRSHSEFMELVAEKRSLYKLRINQHAIRLLRAALNETTRDNETQAEALSVIFESLASLKKTIAPSDIEQWIVAPCDRPDEEAEVKVAGDLTEQPLHNVRKVLATRYDRATKTTYFLFDWEPTYEPASNLPHALVVKFHKERRALVRKKYFEDEALVDDSLNPQ